MTNFDPLVAAFSEYAAKKWDADNWREFGRSTGAADILSGHPRLYRSLGFGDDDYPDAAREVIPKVLTEVTGPSQGERMALVAEFAPDLIDWLSQHGTYRTKKRFAAHLAHNSADIPEEWADGSALLAGGFGSSRPRGRVGHKALDLQSEQPWRRLSTLAPRVTIENEEPKNEEIAIPDPSVTPEKIFIVHGRDTDAVNQVKVFVHSITGIMPQILADQPGGGDTIIEKFEREAETSDYAIVLLTPDDEGRNKVDGGDLKARARQNVILELGYFFGKLGRSKVVVLNGGVEQPSDVHGLNYIAYPSHMWTEELRRELRNVGFSLTG